VFLNSSKLWVDAVNVRRGTVVDAVEDAAVFMRLAYYYSKALSKCKGLKRLFAQFLGFKDFTALEGKQLSLWDS
jgi:hypothetical protein